MPFSCDDFKIQNSLISNSTLPALNQRLEDQMNDLIELHQNEVENLKQIISDMEEKIQYQSEDRLRDINELLENCTTRVIMKFISCSLLSIRFYTVALHICFIPS